MVQYCIDCGHRLRAMEDEQLFHIGWKCNNCGKQWSVEDYIDIKAKIIFKLKEAVEGIAQMKLRIKTLEQEVGLT